MLADRSIAGKVWAVGENGPSDGLIIRHAEGKKYVTSPQDEPVKVRDLSAKDAAPTVPIKDARLRWPDTSAEAPDGTLDLTTAHIQNPSHCKEGAPIALPNELWRFKPDAREPARAGMGSTVPPTPLLTAGPGSIAHR